MGVKFPREVLVIALLAMGASIAYLGNPTNAEVPLDFQAITETAGPEEALQLVLANLRVREARITRLDADFRFEREENDEPDVVAYRDPDFGPVDPRQVWEGHFAFDGTRFVEEQRLVYPEVPGEYYSNSFDGEQGRYYRAAANWGCEVAPENMSTSIAGLSQVGARLKVAHNFKPDEPTQSQLLLDADAQVIGQEKLGGLACYLLERVKGDRVQRWWISSDRDWIVVKYQRIRGPYDEQIVAGRATWTVEDFAQIDGLWMPTVLTGRGEHTRADGRTLWAIKEKLTVIYHGAKDPIPLTTFRPAFPTGTKVQGLEKAYVVGGSN